MTILKYIIIHSYFCDVGPKVNSLECILVAYLFQFLLGLSRSDYYVNFNQNKLTQSIQLVGQRQRQQESSMVHRLLTYPLATLARPRSI